MPITLHVGYGTFKPIDQEDLSNLKLHKEWVSVSRKSGGRNKKKLKNKTLEKKGI